VTDEKQTDAELIERARLAADERMRDEYCDYESGALLFDLADRLAELTKPEPWRSPSEVPESDQHIWTKKTDGTIHLAFFFSDFDSSFDDDVTGWKPIVRPEP
jgi:hypothetical protein